MSKHATHKLTTPSAAAGRSTPGDEPPPFRYTAVLANEIELCWQDRWELAGTFTSANPSGPLAEGFREVAGKPKFYVLDMFPYASGTGIHVGHPEGYIATDVYARYLRMTGCHVLHAMGYDAFGLPAEQFALSTGQHPQVTTRQNVDIMRSQLRRLGMGYDTRRSIETSDPAFYRWTQWIFLKIFNSWVDERTGRTRSIADLIAEYAAGERAVPGGHAWAELTSAERRELIDARRLAYIAEEPVNWCPGLGTVLANEEVTADGRSDIGNFPVYRRPMRQWMLRITAMAQRLADDLDLVNWPENVRQLQRNWIGGSDGAVIRLPVAAPPDSAAPAASVEVFTTRPDTLAGATYVVLAPEHPQVDSLIPASWPAGTPQRWRGPAGASPARDGAGPDGVAPSPAAAVAAYRDATARVSDRQRTGSGPKSGVFTGGYVVNPATGDQIPVFVADYVLMGYGTGAIMAVPAHDERDLDFARTFGLPVRPVIDSGGRYISGPGPELAGLDERAAIDTAINWLERAGCGQAARRYRLRDWLFSRQRYWGEPFPVVYDDSGLPVALPEHLLPVRLPEIADFRPAAGASETSEPVPPLARAGDWVTVELDLGDGPRSYRRELNTMPQWAGSCWYYLRYLDPDNAAAFVDPQIERYWMAGPGDNTEHGGVDLYIGGVEHAVGHLLYARFWHKVLYDLGLVSTCEPFARLFNQGMIQADAFIDDRGIYVPAADVVTGAGGRPEYKGAPVTRRAGKMGKSLKNGISPDELYRQYGADTLRLYEMAMGPLEVDKPWQTDDVIGVHRFLQRLWRSMINERTGTAAVSDAPLDQPALRLLHATIEAVRRDFGQLRFHTAIARLTELATAAARISAAAGALPRELAEPLVLMVAPLAPHIAEELWARLGHDSSLAYADFPRADPALARAQSVSLPVQVNGKTKFTVEVPADARAADIEQLVTADPRYARHVAGLTVSRLIAVPGKIVNIVAPPG